MRGIHPSPQAPAEHRENWRVATEHIQEVYDNGWIEPGWGEVFSGAARVSIPAGTNYAVAVSLPNAATSWWAVNLPIRPQHQNRRVRLRLLYTASAAGTANVSLDVRGRLWRAGGNLATATSMAIATAAALPGPAANQDILDWTVLSPATPLVTPFYDGLSLLFVRNDPDANANDLHILGVYYEFIPS